MCSSDLRRLGGEKKHTHARNLCCSLFLLLSAKSRSELIKTEKELVRAEHTNETGVGGEAGLSGLGEKGVRVCRGPQCILPGPGPSLRP